MINGLCVQISTAAKVLIALALFTLTTSTNQPMDVTATKAAFGIKAKGKNETRDHVSKL